MSSMTMIAQTPVEADGTQNSKKRKRIVDAPDELEVDITAPEPPSKKALRKAKKGKSASAPIATPNHSKDEEDAEIPTAQPEVATISEATPSKRSPHGIWIGNLPYTATKANLRTFLTNNTTITEPMITRIHMPAPTDASTSRQKSKPQNKGFAYVDFSSAEAVAGAIRLSDTLLAGRGVLIKDAHNFEGRPEKAANGTQDAATETSLGKSPSKRIFVGNLTFDTEKGDLEEHFSQCGEVADVHVATFEDSGKCKGYAWVTFAEVSAAEAAARGWITRQPENDEEEGDEDEEQEGVEKVGEEIGASTEKTKKSKRKKPKPRQWWVNRLKGRQLRMEFAEDASVRYKKRFGKDPSRADEKTSPRVEEKPPSDSAAEARAAAKPTTRPPRPPRKVDARTVKPGAALAAAPRLTGGIVASQGKKVTFD